MTLLYESELPDAHAVSNIAPAVTTAAINSLAFFILFPLLLV